MSDCLSAYQITIKRLSFPLTPLQRQPTTQSMCCHFKASSHRRIWILITYTLFSICKQSLSPPTFIVEAWSTYSSREPRSKFMPCSPAPSRYHSVQFPAHPEQKSVLWRRFLEAWILWDNKGVLFLKLVTEKTNTDLVTVHMNCAKYTS